MTGSLEHNPGLLDDAARAEIVLYQSDGSNVPVEVRYLNETFWLTQREMAELFDVDRSVITKHLRNVFEEGELEKESTSANIALVRAEGSRQVKRQVEIYNLDAIIAVGYRVNSLKATRLGYLPFLVSPCEFPLSVRPTAASMNFIVASVGFLE